MTGYEYGNTRLRVRMTRLLDRADLLGLLAAGDLDRMLGGLASRGYGPDVEAALTRARGEARLDEAVRTHLARSLREMRSFYDGPAGEGLDLVLGRWDLRNLLVLLRTRRIPSPDIPVVPAGVVSDAVLRELGAQPTVRAMVELMVAWSLPDPGTARSLLGSLGPMESGDDPTLVEAVLVRGHAERVAAELAARPDDAVSRQLRAETDARNLMAALRVWEARAAGEPVPDNWALPGGTVDEATWRAVAAAGTREDAAARLSGRLRPRRLAAAVTAWAGHGNLLRLADDLEGALVAVAVARLGSDDPLGPAIPVAYVWAKEEEARLLRLVGRVFVHGFDPAEIEGHIEARLVR